MTCSKKQLCNEPVYRPWGSYLSLIKDKNYQVKKIVVNPGESLSLQLHNYRSEHWVVTKGKALITNGNIKKIFNANEHTFIPEKTKHRIENTGTEVVEIIETQYGKYLEEDDIIRFDDKYNRTD